MLRQKWGGCLISLTSETAASKRICPTCGHRISPDEYVCPHCGNVFRKGRGEWDWKLIGGKAKADNEEEVGKEKDEDERQSD